MELDEFKRIFYYEYAHRLLGRMIGLTFLLPAGYFVARNYLNKTMIRKLGLIGGLIGCQGILGWYMVKSGLRREIVDKGEIPRVSHYRLAAHLGSAFTIYTLMLWNGLNILFPGTIDGTAPSLAATRQLKHWCHLATMMIFFTALSGMPLGSPASGGDETNNSFFSPFRCLRSRTRCRFDLQYFPEDGRKVDPRRYYYYGT
jgi:heme a synthase